MLKLYMPWNPKTNRKIKKSSPLYNKLLKTYSANKLATKPTKKRDKKKTACKCEKFSHYIVSLVRSNSIYEIRLTSSINNAINILKNMIGTEKTVDIDTDANIKKQIMQFDFYEIQIPDIDTGEDLQFEIHGVNIE